MHNLTDDLIEDARELRDEIVVELDSVIEDRLGTITPKKLLVLYAKLADRLEDLGIDVSNEMFEHLENRAATGNPVRTGESNTNVGENDI